jgi:hypothetical protein
MIAVRFLDMMGSFIARALLGFGSGGASRVEKPSFFALLARTQSQRREDSAGKPSLGPESGVYFLQG